MVSLKQKRRQGPNELKMSTDKLPDHQEKDEKVSVTDKKINHVVLVISLTLSLPQNPEQLDPLGTWSYV